MATEDADDLVPFLAVATRVDGATTWTIWAYTSTPEPSREPCRRT
jgi:hypothetical protein